jgi:hypothetical protein
VDWTGALALLASGVFLARLLPQLLRTLRTGEVPKGTQNALRGRSCRVSTLTEVLKRGTDI